MEVTWKGKNQKIKHITSCDKYENDGLKTLFQNFPVCNALG